MLTPGMCNSAMRSFSVLQLLSSPLMTTGPVMQVVMLSICFRTSGLGCFGFCAHVSIHDAVLMARNTHWRAGLVARSIRSLLHKISTGNLNLVTSIRKRQSLVVLDGALQRMERVDLRRARIVKLQFRTRVATIRKDVLRDRAFEGSVVLMAIWIPLRESLYGKYRGFIAQATGGHVHVNRLLSESGQRLSSVVASILVRLMHS